VAASSEKEALVIAKVEGRRREKLAARRRLNFDVPASTPRHDGHPERHLASSDHFTGPERRAPLVRPKHHVIERFG
jgi:hypothetical protein